MMTPSELEGVFLEFAHNLQKHAPDGVIDMNLERLYEMGLLKYNVLQSRAAYEDLVDAFHVVETADRVSLFNERFMIWIFPQIKEQISMTMTFIALFRDKKPHLELVFSTSGVYNSPSLILKILSYFLSEVTDTESMISSMSDKKKRS